MIWHFLKNCWKSPRSYQTGANCEKVWPAREEELLEKPAVIPNWRKLWKGMPPRGQKASWKSPRSYQTGADCEKVWPAREEELLEKFAVIPNRRWLRKGMAGEGRRICWKSPRSYQPGAGCEKIWPAKEEELLEKSAVIPNWRKLRKGMAGEGRRIVGKVRGHTKLALAAKRYALRAYRMTFQASTSRSILQAAPVWYDRGLFQLAF